MEVPDSEEVLSQPSGFLRVSWSLQVFDPRSVEMTATMTASQIEWHHCDPPWNLSS